MTTQVRCRFLAMSAISLLWLTGCSDNNVEPAQNEDEITNLIDNFGGYKATDEQPAFGDPEVAALESSDEANDPMARSADVDSIVNLPEVDVYSVELLWGHLELDSSETDITDWSGSLSVERGAIVAVRLIRFEAGDFIVRPRTSRTLLEFVSKTQPSFDGMLVYVYDPQATEAPTENTLTFTSSSVFAVI